MEAETTGKWAGIPMTEEELKDYEQVWIDMEENIKLVYKNGKNI